MTHPLREDEKRERGSITFSFHLKLLFYQLCSAKLFTVKLLNIQKDAVCARLDRTPIRRINDKNTILDVATSERNANEENTILFCAVGDVISR